MINVIDVAFLVGERTRPSKVADDLANGAAQAVVVYVIAAVSGLAVGFEVFRGDGRADEDEVVAEIVTVQDLRCDRIEKSLSQLGLFVVKQQADVKQLDLLPGSIVDGFDFEFVAQALDAFIDAVVIETDAFADCGMDPRPIAVFEAILGLPAGLPEQGVVLVEALDHCQGDAMCIGAVEADRDFHRAEPRKSVPNTSIGQPRRRCVRRPFSPREIRFR